MSEKGRLRPTGPRHRSAARRCKAAFLPSLTAVRHPAVARIGTVLVSDRPRATGRRQCPIDVRRENGPAQGPFMAVGRGGRRNQATPFLTLYDHFIWQLRAGHCHHCSAGRSRWSNCRGQGARRRHSDCRNSEFRTQKPRLKQHQPKHDFRKQG